MEKQVICKVVTPFGTENPRPYLLAFKDGGLSRHPDLRSVAAQLRVMYSNFKHPPFVFIKNEAPGDIIWKRDDTLAHQSWECERLSKSEIHQLALLLKEG